MTQIMTTKVYYLKIEGYVGKQRIIAFVYQGKDANLSHYKYNGKIYVGTVQFDEIYDQRTIYY